MDEEMARKKAKQLLDQADGEQGTFFLWRSKDNFSQACEHYKQAAVQYKIATDWDTAAQTYLKAADLYMNKCQDKMNATQCYCEAALCYKQTNISLSVECYTRGAQGYQELNRYASAAKIYDDLGQLFDQELMDRPNGIKSYNSAGDCYKAANSATTAHGCYLKAANLLSANQQYTEAIRIYEQTAEFYAKSGTMPHQVNGACWKSILCMMVQEVKDRANTLVKTQALLDRYVASFPTFDGEDKTKLLFEIIIAYNEANEENFQTSLQKRRYSLDQWSIDMLVVVKRGMTGDIPDQAQAATKGSGIPTGAGETSQGNDETHAETVADSLA